MVKSILDEAVMLELELMRVPFRSVQNLETALLDAEERTVRRIRRERPESTDVIGKQRRRNLLNEINGYYEEPFKEYESKLLADITERSGLAYESTGVALSSHYAVIKGEKIAKAFDTIPIVALKRITDPEMPLVGSGLLKDEVKTLGIKTQTRVRRVVASGLVTGASNDEMQREIRNSARITNKEARSLARTATATAMNEARQEALKPFKREDIITGYEWIAVLDMRVTFGCASLNGIVRKRVEDFPMIPRHFNCRSVIMPRTILSDDETETRPFTIHDERKVKHRDVVREDGTRIDGGSSTRYSIPRHKAGEKKGEIIKSRRGDVTLKRPVKGSKKSIGDNWLEHLEGKGQGPWIRKYFGEVRYKLWKKEGLGFHDLIDHKDLSPLSVKEIKRRINRKGFKGVRE